MFRSVPSASDSGAAQEDRHRHHAVRLVHLREVQAVVRQPVRREPPRLGFLLDDEQHRIAAAVGPMHQHRCVEFAEAVAEAFLELLLAQRHDLHVVPGLRRLFGGEEGQGVAGIVDDEVLEVLVVADVRHGSRLVSGWRKWWLERGVPGYGRWLTRRGRISYSGGCSRTGVRHEEAGMRALGAMEGLAVGRAYVLGGGGGDSVGLTSGWALGRVCAGAEWPSAAADSVGLGWVSQERCGATRLPSTRATRMPPTV